MGFPRPSLLLTESEASFTSPRLHTIWVKPFMLTLMPLAVHGIHASIIFAKEHVILLTLPLQPEILPTATGTLQKTLPYWATEPAPGLSTVPCQVILHR